MLEALKEFNYIANFDYTGLPWPESPKGRVLETLRFLLDGSMAERRKSQSRKEATPARLNDLAWCFVAGPDFRPIPARMIETLEKLMGAGTIYFTPNTFFSRRRKTCDALRWLNCVFADIDDPAMTDLDVLDKCREVGLPKPSLINKTPRGLHVYWKIQQVRATEKALKLYSRVLRAVAVAFEADVKAATPEHFLRIPRVILRFERIEYELRDFLVLLDDELDGEHPTTAAGGRIVAQSIVGHPAILKLLEGVKIGRRNNTCFTLARAFRWSGYNYQETLRELLTWNQRNQPPLRESEVRATVRSAYRGPNRPPKARWIRELSGVLFSYRVFEKRSGRKPGRPRKQEVAKEKFLAMIQEAGGTLTTCDSRKKIAAQLGVSERTLNSVIAALVAEGLLSVSTRRLGRGNGTETTYTIAAELEAACSEFWRDAEDNAGGESETRQVLGDAVECYDKLIEITGKADNTDLVFFVKLLLRHRKREVFEALAALREIKARDPTGFLVETPKRWLTEILLI